MTLTLGQAGVHLDASRHGTVIVRLTNTATGLLGRGRLRVTATIALSDHTKTNEQLTLVAATPKRNHHGRPQ